MSEWKSSGTVVFHDESREIARLTFVGLKDSSIQTRNGHKPELYSEQLRLMEAQMYEWELSCIQPGLRIRETPEVSRSKLNPLSGLFRPGNSVGLYSFILESESGERRSEAYVEIEPTKIGCREDFQQMLNDISDVSVDLLLRLNTHSRVLMNSDWRRRPAVLSQLFGVLRSAVCSDEFQMAVRQVVSEPHRILIRHESECDVSRGSLNGRVSPRAFHSNGRRVQLGSGHPLAQSSLGRCSIPASIRVTRHKETLDTSPNQFVKYALESFVEVAAAVESHVRGRPNGNWFLKEVVSVREKLETSLSDSLFREVSTPKAIDLGSPVLQRKEGYRELLRIWLRFMSAAQLAWKPGSEVYSCGLRDIAQLYEYWVFFKLLGVCKNVFEFESRSNDELFAITSSGIELVLKAGEPWRITGEWQGENPLRVAFSYNKTFSPNSDWHKCSSWTRPMRPDFTISMWPKGMSESESERLNEIVHVHFDAKYRIEAIDQLFGGAVELDQERAEQQRGTYRRQDLLKMHAYRDAIRRTDGAYVLYPGDANCEWRVFTELLPGLGAIALRPTASVKNSTNAFLEQFLRDLAIHSSNQRSQRATIRQQVRQTYYGTSPSNGD